MQGLVSSLSWIFLTSSCAKLSSTYYQNWNVLSILGIRNIINIFEDANLLYSLHFPPLRTSLAVSGSANCICTALTLTIDFSICNLNYPPERFQKAYQSLAKKTLHLISQAISQILLSIEYTYVDPLKCIPKLSMLSKWKKSASIKYSMCESRK